MTFKRDSLSDIRARLISRVNSEISGGDANLRFSPEGVIATMNAMAVHEINGYLNYISRQILLETADAEFLDLHAGGWGIFRKPASMARGRVNFTGTNGNTIPAGTILKRADDVQYTLDADVTIIAGTGQGNITAVVAGASANAVIATKLSLPSPVAGIQSQVLVANDGSGAGLSGGADIESDDAYRARAIQRKRQPPQGGAAHDYEEWALRVSGVTRAWVYPNQYGAGTVAIAFVMDNKPGTIIPSSLEVAAVQDLIEDLRPVGADVTVFAPELQAVNFEIHLSPNTLIVQAAVIAELQDLFLRESKPGGVIRISHIREAVSLAVGEIDHIVVAPAADVVMSFGKIPTLGVMTWGAI